MIHRRSAISSFSRAEKDYRWKRARHFLSTNNLDALVVVTSRFGEPLDRYLSNWIPGCTVIFPLEGDPTLLVPMVGPLLTIGPDTPEETRPWIEDFRPSARGPSIAAVLQEKGLDRGRLGVVGLGPLRTDWEGWVPYGTWERVLKRLPNCTFEDVTSAYAELLLPKSEQELKHVRRAAEVLEEASLEMVKVVRSGVSELEVYSTFRRVIDENGLYGPFEVLTSGAGNVGFWVPLWLHGIGEPRVLEPGDILLAEVFASSGGLEAQVQVAVAIPPVSPVVERCAQLARQGYEAGLRELRPGKKFADVVRAMHDVLEEPGVWTLTPQIHSMNPMLCVGPTGMKIDLMPGFENYRDLGSGRIRGGDVILEAGMVFELEPNACIERHRVNIGGTAIVTSKGGEALNTVATRMRLPGDVQDMNNEA